MQEYVDCYAGIVEDGKMYIPSMTYALLLEYDLENWEWRCPIDFTDLFKELPMRAMAVFKVGEHMYLVLRNTYRILECNLRTGEIVWIGEQPVYEDSEELLINAFRIGNEIWSIPGNIQNIIQIFDIRSKKFTELSMSEQINGYENMVGFLEGAVCGDSIYLPVFGYHSSNLICQILCKEKTIKIWPLKESVFLHTLSSYEGEIWFSDFRNPVFPELCQWEREQGIMETIRLGRCDWRKRDKPQDVTLIREIIAYREKLVVIPHYSNELIVIDREQNNERRLAYPAGFKRIALSEGKEMFRGFYVQNEQVFLFPCAYNGVLILNMDTEALEFQELRLNRKEHERYYEIHYQEKSRKGLFFFEGESLLCDRGRFFLTDYIEQIEADKKGIQSGKKDMSGKRIYAFLTDGGE